MTPLRQRMLEDMQIRNLSENTQRSYVEHVSRFARHFGRSPEAFGPEEIRAYQVYLTNEKKLAPGSIVIAVCRAALSLHGHAQARMGGRPKSSPRPRSRRPCRSCSVPTKSCDFSTCVRSLKHRTILTTCYAAGLRISEAVHLTATDIDSQRMVLRIEQGQGAEGSLRDALAQAARDLARLVAREPTDALAVPRRSPDEPDHQIAVERACRRPHRRSGIPKADHAPFAAPRLCRPPPGSGDRRPHDSIAARPSHPRHDCPVSAHCDEHGVRDDEPAGLAPAPRPAGDHPCAPCISEYGGGRPTLEVADIFRRYGDRYRQAHAAVLPRSGAS